MAFPGLRMIVAHLGHPWEEDLVALVRKAPNVCADISACHYRPWRYWQAMATACEYGVTHKLLLGSDFPSRHAGQRHRRSAPRQRAGGGHAPAAHPGRRHRIDHLENWKGGVPGVGADDHVRRGHPCPRGAHEADDLGGRRGTAARVRLRHRAHPDERRHRGRRRDLDERRPHRCDPVPRREPAHRARPSWARTRRSCDRSSSSSTALLDGSEPAKAGVEMALIDIIGKVRGPARL